MVTIFIDQAILRVCNFKFCGTGLWKKTTHICINGNKETFGIIQQNSMKIYS